MASKRQLRRRACAGKLRWATAAAALAALYRTCSTGRLNVYRCPLGGSHFHLGHVRVRALRAERRAG